MRFICSASQNGCQPKPSSAALFADDHGNSSLQQQTQQPQQQLASHAQHNVRMSAPAFTLAAKPGQSSLHLYFGQAAAFRHKRLYVTKHQFDPSFGCHQPPSMKIHSLWLPSSGIFQLLHLLALCTSCIVCICRDCETIVEHQQHSGTCLVPCNVPILLSFRVIVGMDRM